jgi:hypothetical protein
VSGGRDNSRKIPSSAMTEATVNSTQNDYNRNGMHKGSHGNPSSH